MRKNAFTLVEMLVVMAILSIFGILFLTIFSRSLKGSNKSQIIGVIKQNGQAVLETIDKTVRNADNVVCPTLTDACVTIPPCKTLVVVQKGIYTRYRYKFFPPLVSPKTNGLIQQDNPVKQPVLGTGREETGDELRNRICGEDDPMLPEAVILTDTNTQTGVSVKSGSFKRDRQAGFKDQITIQFVLDNGEQAPSALAGQIDPIIFQTTVQLR